MSNFELNTENIFEVKDAVIETAPETTPVFETTEEVVNAVAEEKKSKNFFEIFKKDKAAEEAAEEAAAVKTIEDAAVAEEVAAVKTIEDAAVSEEVAAVKTIEDAAVAEEVTEEVPVESAPAKKSGLCGLCAFGKKSEATEEAAAPATEGEATGAVTEEVPAAEATAEEAAAAEDTAVPLVAAAAETSEGEAVQVVAEANVVRSGVMFKSGKFFKSHMNERHCRIFSNGVFQWSKTDDYSKTRECKCCAETTTVAFMADGENTPHKYRFELHCCNTVTIFALDSKEDRDEWIRAIETAKECCN